MKKHTRLDPGKGKACLDKKYDPFYLKYSG
jgi:hypothetical protein